MMNDVKRHYDLLIDEGNDPVLDPPELAAYMDGWDGAAFLELLQLSGTQDVLEIGVGTGRLALRTVPHCRSFTGVDISAKTIQRAGENLAALPNVTLICADFLAWETLQRFDVVYSSLTFLHIADKRRAAERAAALLKPGGRLVLSLDKCRDAILDYGTRWLTVYPDDSTEMARLLTECGMVVQPVTETAFAHIITAIRKGEEV